MQMEPNGQLHEVFQSKHQQDIESQVNPVGKGKVIQSILQVS